MTQLRGLSASCFGCLAASPRQKPEELARACIRAGSSSTSPVNSVAGRSAAKDAGERGAIRPGAQAESESGGQPAEFRVYSGSYGIGVLTSAEIIERDSIILPSSLDRRAVLYTKLASPVGEIHAFCTHLTANLGGVPHPGGASWQRDQSAQIDALMSFIARKAGDREPAILSGDLNTGPAIGANIRPNLPSHYARIISHGFLNPYAAQKDVRCTYCFDNPLDGGGGLSGLLIDHVLLRGFEGDILGTQMMRAPLMVYVGGRSVKSGFSDHYGVVVTLSKQGS